MKLESRGQQKLCSLDGLSIFFRNFSVHCIRTGNIESPFFSEAFFKEKKKKKKH